MKKKNLLILLLCLGSSYAFGLEKKYKNIYETYMNFDFDKNNGIYQHTLDQKAWLGTFQIEKIHGSSYFGKFFQMNESLTCEGDLNFEMDSRLRKVNIQWNYQKGEGCPYKGNIQKTTLYHMLQGGGSGEEGGSLIPSLKDIKIISSHQEGSGCLKENTSTMITSSVPQGPADFLEIIYDDFILEKTPAFLQDTAQKECTVKVDLEIPSGWQFSFLNVQHIGFAHIAPSSIGSFYNAYTFPSSSHVESARVFWGPFEGEYQKDDEVSFLTQNWSSCSSQKVSLILKSQMKISGPQEEASFMTVDHQTHLFSQKWGMSWKKCSSL